MKRWMCMNCGWIYDEDKGDPEGGIPPGTPWEAVPDDWRCPDCGSSKSDFDLTELT
jgi:rubredoxin-NAD+ reductase